MRASLSHKRVRPDRDAFEVSRSRLAELLERISFKGGKLLFGYLRQVSGVKALSHRIEREDNCRATDAIGRKFERRRLSAMRRILDRDASLLVISDDRRNLRGPAENRFHSPNRADKRRRLPPIDFGTARLRQYDAGNGPLRISNDRGHLAGRIGHLDSPDQNRSTWLIRGDCNTDTIDQSMEDGGFVDRALFEFSEDRPIDVGNSKSGGRRRTHRRINIDRAEASLQTIEVPGESRCRRHAGDQLAEGLVADVC